jgi:APA family basic amino acid/polyamine antiporter
MRELKSHEFSLQPPASDVTPNPPNELRPVLDMKDVVLMIVGTVIGSGIFLVPSVVLRVVGNSVPMALLAWVAGGILSLLGALTYGELSAMKPKTGGLYVYIRDGFGPFPAFLFGWTMFFVISSGSIATLAVAFGHKSHCRAHHLGHCGREYPRNATERQSSEHNDRG